MNYSSSSDQMFMRRALALADIAAQHGEVPVGAVVVHEGKIIGEGYNQPITSLDPSAHAEMVAIRAAAKTLGNYRLVDCTLYVTVEPCTMCTGLLVHSRIGRLVFGAKEAKAGAICSAMDVQQLQHLNHKFFIESGVLAHECSAKMTAFFQERRERKKQLRQAGKPQKEN